MHAHCQGWWQTSGGNAPCKTIVGSTGSDAQQVHRPSDCCDAALISACPTCTCCVHRQLSQLSDKQGVEAVNGRFADVALPVAQFCGVQPVWRRRISGYVTTKAAQPERHKIPSRPRVLPVPSRGQLPAERLESCHVRGHDPGPALCCNLGHYMPRTRQVGTLLRTRQVQHQNLASGLDCLCVNGWPDEAAPSPRL